MKPVGEAFLGTEAPVGLAPCVTSVGMTMALTPVNINVTKSTMDLLPPL